MKLGIASWSFIISSLIVFLIAQDSGARKIAITSGREIQQNEVSYGLKQLATVGHILTNIIQVEGPDVEMNNKHVKKDDDDYKKTGKQVDDDDKDDDDEDDQKKSGKQVVDDDDHHHKKTGKHDDDDDDSDDDDSDEEDEEDEDDDDDDERKKTIGKKVQAYKPSRLDHNHMDPELNVFFTPGDLKVGRTMPIYFAKKDSSTSPKFLPREKANQIPFSSKELPFLLKFFSFSKYSLQAKAMKYTLEQCEFEPMEGETKFCATSLESLIDFARHLFGSNVQFKVLTTTRLTNSTVLLQNYTISEVKEISVPHIIGCHPMPYPHAVFYCHSQEGDTSLYEVLVEGQNGGRVQAAAICHMDTSKWDPDHVCFRVLNVEPGSSPVCHFFPSDNLIWVPLPAALQQGP